MPENLPALYRAHIDDLVATLNKDEIVERAADELHRLIARIVVRHEPAAGGHTMEIFGNLVVLLVSLRRGPRSGSACGRARGPVPR